MTDLHTAEPGTSPVRSRCGLDRAQIDALGDRLAERPSFTLLQFCAYCTNGLPYPEHMRPKGSTMFDRPARNVGITPPRSWRDVDHTADVITVNVVSARTTVGDHAAVCELRIGTLEGNVVFTGSAKLNPNDRPDPDRRRPRVRPRARPGRRVLRGLGQPGVDVSDRPDIGER